MADMIEQYGYLYSNGTMVIQGRKSWQFHEAKFVAYLETRSTGE